jgi:hypothetical protein
VVLSRLSSGWFYSVAADLIPGWSYHTMADFLFLMHRDAAAAVPAEAWPAYLAMLRGAGVFDGGSAIGDGVVMRKDGARPPITAHLSGYIRIQTENLAAAQRLIAGNPVYESGGTVEIRELPRD